MKNHCRLIILLVIVIIAVLITGCNDIELNSKWKNQDIIIDGINTEWQGGYYIKEASTSINIYNDAEYIYIGVISSDRQLPMKIFGNGMIVWFDPNNNKDKILGIHFPIGMTNSEIPLKPGEIGDNEEKMKEIFAKTLNEYEIIRKNKEVETRLSTLGGKGIQLKISNEQNKFLYEMKIPLKQNNENLYAIDADTSKTISIGFETAEMDFDKMKERIGDENGPPGVSSGIPPSGGIPGGGGMPGGGQPGRKEMSKPLKVWLSVKLSSGVSVH
jgi:hypothetical protein